MSNLSTVKPLNENGEPFLHNIDPGASEAFQGNSSDEDGQGQGDGSDGGDVLQVNGNNAGEGSVGQNKKKKKKQKKKKKSSAGVIENGGGVPPEIPTPKAESSEERDQWMKELGLGVRTYQLVPWGLLELRYRKALEIFRTPACSNFELRTPRLKLRQVEPGDTTAIRRIKMEPIVQKTQLYGSPSASDIKDSFQNRYVRSSIPRASFSNGNRFRDEYVFAITAKDPTKITVQPAGQMKTANRISNAEGYLGNIAIRLDLNKRSNSALFPTPRTIYTQPTFSQTTTSELTGNLFYELHPQVWGQGLASEAFTEVLRFAIEEVGCTLVMADPTEGNNASIRLCEKSGMKFLKSSCDNDYKKVQLFYGIERGEWFKINRPGKVVESPWAGKEVCRWCMNFRLAPPTFSCEGCGWAKYCSRECQRADWCRSPGGHQEECNVKVS